MTGVGEDGRVETFKEMCKNPLFVVAISYAEVLPVGLVVAFISALIVKRKPGTGCWLTTARAVFNICYHKGSP